jgi:hypothetical protein
MKKIIKSYNLKNSTPTFYCRVVFLLVAIINLCGTVTGQDTSFQSKHAAIFFPYPMYKEKWRSSIGFTLMTTPEDITEEVRLRVPCGDYRLLRRINNHFILDSRLWFQVLQNHLSTGLRYSKPLTNNLYFSAGDDIGFWFGVLKLGGFNSKASGVLNYSNVSLGYKTKKELLITFKAQISINLYYQAVNGDDKFSSNQAYYNGETFTLALEQPFYNKKHLTLAVSAINNYFYWQTWALFYKTNRKVFYPQITVGFIL